MGNFWRISTELQPLNDLRNCFSLSIFGIPLPIFFKLCMRFHIVKDSDSFTILGLWVLGLAVSNINEFQLQTYECKPLFLMTSLQY